MRKKLFAAILLFLVLNDNTFTNSDKINSEESTRTSAIMHKHIEQIKKESCSQSLIKKYKLKGDFNEEAISKIRKMAFKLNVKEEWLYQLFYLESRGNPQAVNLQKGDPIDPYERVKLGRATGLIQFIPTTANHLGTSLEALYSMTVSEQCDWVEKYLIAVKTKKNIQFNDFTDLYFAVFYQSAINQSDNYILGKSKSDLYAQRIAQQNKGIDLAGDNNGTISVSDVKAWLDKHLSRC